MLVCNVSCVYLVYVYVTCIITVLECFTGTVLLYVYDYILFIAPLRLAL